MECRHTAGPAEEAGKEAGVGAAALTRADHAGCGHGVQPDQGAAEAGREADQLAQ